MNNNIDKKEKLNLWDRFFNRYKKEIHNRGHETWVKQYPAGYWYAGQNIPNSEFKRHFIEYIITDRVTGSQTIKKEYFD